MPSDYWREHREYVETAKRLKQPCPCGESDLWPGQTCKACGRKDERKKRKPKR